MPEANTALGKTAVVPATIDLSQGKPSIKPYSVSSSSSDDKPIGMIIGIVVGSVIVLGSIVLILVYIFCCKNSKSSKDTGVKLEETE